MITRKCERCGQESDGWRYCLTCARGMYHGWKKKLRVQLRYMKRLLSQHNLCLTIGVGKHYIVADAGGGDLPVDAYLFLSDRGVRLKTVC